ncbi:MAG: epimerase [Candidatus Riflebacteria bacterium HGW-Riflebacteria-1]|jgi:dTDP-L-rhamnose 4-epimerase|nr:MAG: epimerase [Candidatus Riflebacteria bacterium HGW-Riflebacteria-1]
MKNILITGGAGFIGSNLSLHLLSKGYAITVIDCLSSQIHGDEPTNSSLYKTIKDKVTFFHADVSCKSFWEQAIQGQDAIIHLAAETGTGQSMYEIEKYVNTNVGGTALMWDILANQAHSVKKVVVASSRAVYGEGKYNCSKDGDVFPVARKESDMSMGDFSVKCPICNTTVVPMATSEDSKLSPSSIYGFTKHAQEEMCLIAGKAMQIPVVAFRYQNVYGPGQSLKNPYTGILSIFSTRISNGNEIQIFEDGRESRDFVFIDDVVKATVLGLEKDEGNYQVLNVGTGVQTDVLTVASLLKSEFNSSIDVRVTGDYRLGDIRDNFADLTQITNLLGYKPSVSFADGIKRFVAWVKSQEISEDNYLSSIEQMKKRGLYKS